MVGPPKVVCAGRTVGANMDGWLMMSGEGCFFRPVVAVAAVVAAVVAAIALSVENGAELLS